MAVCDIFTCGEHTKPEKGVEYMKQMFNADDIDIICNDLWKIDIYFI